MIEIKQAPEGNVEVKSSVSDFCACMGYCEIRIKHYLKGIKPLETQITIDGAKSHKKEEIYEKEHFKFEPVTPEELLDLSKDIEFAREGLFTRFLRELWFGEEKVSLLLYGRADKVMRSKGTLIVEDSKFPATKHTYQNQSAPFDNQKLQTLLYLNSNFSATGSLKEDECFDISYEKKAWIINIKDKATLQSLKIFQGIQTKESEDFLNQKLQRFALLALGKAEPEHHNNSKKCQSCRFEECESCL